MQLGLDVAREGRPQQEHQQPPPQQQHAQRNGARAAEPHLPLTPSDLPNASSPTLTTQTPSRPLPRAPLRARAVAATPKPPPPAGERPAGGGSGDGGGSGGSAPEAPPSRDLPRLDGGLPWLGALGAFDLTTLCERTDKGLGWRLMWVAWGVWQRRRRHTGLPHFVCSDRMHSRRAPMKNNRRRPQLIISTPPHKPQHTHAHTPDKEAQAQMVAKKARVLEVTVAGRRSVFLRHPDDVARVLRDPGRFAKSADTFKRLGLWLGSGLVSNLDAASHAVRGPLLL